MKRYTDIHEQIIYGLETVDEDRKIEVNLKDMLYVYKTLIELVNFLHQPLHYPTLRSFINWVGDRNSGIYREVSECVYSKMQDIWPEDIQEMLEDGDFYNPNPPFYYSEETEKK